MPESDRTQKRTLDAPLSLALMTKAQLVFQETDTLVSFPLTPIVYKAKMLEAVAKNMADEQSQWFIPEFSRLVNFLPNGVLWQPEAAETLSSIYGAVIKDARLAASTRTAQEERRLELVSKLLFLRDEQGGFQESAASQTYRAYRDRQFVLEQEYRNAESTALNANDAQRQQQWLEVDAPVWQARLKAHGQDWLLHGKKQTIETAMAEYQHLDGKNPITTWNNWSSGFEAALDLNNNDYYPTGFEPHNILDQPWSSFTLSGEEANVLLARADPMLKARLNPQGVSLEVVSVSIEFRSVRLNRPWFAKALFESRFWKLPNDTVLSDGNAVASGRCPQYVTALVFARNIRLTLKTPTIVATGSTVPIGAIRKLDLGMFAVKLQSVKASQADDRAVIQPQPMVFSRLDTPQLRILQAVPLEVKTSSPPPAPSEKAMLEKTLTTLNRGRFKALSNVSKPEMFDLDELILVKPIRIKPLVASETGPPVTVPQAAEPPVVEPGSETSTQVGGDEDIFVFALISKRLPKCPDPDLNLTWT